MIIQLILGVCFGLYGLYSAYHFRRFSDQCLAATRYLSPVDRKSVSAFERRFSDGLVLLVAIVFMLFSLQVVATAFR